MTEAELIMEEKLRKKKEEDEAMWQEYIEQWRKQRAKEETELKKLKERQGKRKVQRAEQEKRLMELKRKQEDKARKEADEKKNKEADAKRKRLEEAERKRQAMLEEQRKLKEAKPNFVINKKGDGAAPAINPAAFDKMSNIDQARAEMGKNKEQLAEDKQIALKYRIAPLRIEGLSGPKLTAYAEELWSKIVTLESEKYDLEDRMKRQDYDLRELTERQKQINRQKALKKGIDPAEAEGKYPPKIVVASKFERRVDRRTFGDKKHLFDGVCIN